MTRREQPRGPTGGVWPFVISIISLLISIGTLLYTMRTSAVTQRPHVGVMGVIWVSEQAGTPAWRFVIKNTGAQPARVRTAKNQTILTTENVTTVLPTTGDPLWHTVLMPGVESEVFGSAGDRDPAPPLDAVGDACR